MRALTPATRFIMQCAPELNAEQVVKLAENEGIELVSPTRVYAVRAWMARRRDGSAAHVARRPRKRKRAPKSKAQLAQNAAALLIRKSAGRAVGVSDVDLRALIVAAGTERVMRILEGLQRQLTQGILRS